MPGNRRDFIKKTLALSAYAVAAAAGWLASFPAFAQWPAENFSPGKLEDTLKRLFKDRKITETDQIQIKIPKIAENGAVVPMTITSSLADVQSLFILVEKNPVPLAARFEVAPELDVFVSARIKMAKTCNVIVIAETGKALYSARELVKVTIGGCGG